jgi:hypothetical protein
MPAISSEGENSCREQIRSRRSAVLDDPLRVTVDRRRHSLARLERESPAIARHFVLRGKHCHVNSWVRIGDSPNLGTCVWTFPAVQLAP